MRKFYNQKTFKINDYLAIECATQNTNYGFRHVATLLLNGIERDTAKCCYYNRTWECYEYQSVIHGLIGKTKILTDTEKELIRHKLDGKDGYDGEGCKGDLAGLATIGMIAKLGDVLCKDQKEKNDWKERMLKAGLEGKGLIMPEDWNELDEDTKQARLDGAIKQLAK
jgi:hypothetical protein